MYRSPSTDCVFKYSMSSHLCRSLLLQAYRYIVARSPSTSMKIFLYSSIITAATAATIASDCSSTQSSAIEDGNQACEKLANAAAKAAESGSEETFQEFFKDTTQSTRSLVAENYRKVADECSSRSGESIITSYCTNQRNYCQGGLLAYTEWSYQGADRTASTYYCPSYFDLAPSSTGCGEQSQGSNTLHETTHAAFGTKDVAYGLGNVKSLSNSQALENADTYTFYAIGSLILSLS